MVLFMDISELKNSFSNPKFRFAIEIPAGRGGIDWSAGAHLGFFEGAHFQKKFEN